MKNNKILVTGALGRLGSAVTKSLRDVYGAESVIASDIKMPSDRYIVKGPYERINVLSTSVLSSAMKEHDISAVYHLAAIHPTDAAISPLSAWELEVTGLMNVLEVAVECKVSKVFWPTNSANDLLTVAGIAKLAGEHWCRYYRLRYNLDVRTLRMQRDESCDVSVAEILDLMGVAGVESN
jgi:nucleoside-diphosphate-sugar epimerase